ncbi:hypothetical protein QBC37DRAFT_393585 [Rhypophila decipiens]|uniref:Uncharacterized protein n=1 Tax=Rhypophila decipiens TaxID=261697 RepID=A0AAN7B1A8_9PEZI|nr:hypothetical protein QBC37DRAFT_393585 [Rhypophila decipiens]
MATGSGATERCRRPSLRPRWQTPSSLADGRPIRTRKPSAKVLEAQRNLETAQELSKKSANRVIRASSPNDLGQRTNGTLDFIDIGKAIIRKVEEITARSLNQTALDQTRAELREVSAELGQVKAEVQVTRSGTKEEFRTVKSEIHAVRESVEKSVVGLQTGSYASVAATPNITVTNADSWLSVPATRSLPSSLLNVPSNSVSPGSSGEIRKTLDRAYGNHENTKSIMCRGLTRSSKDENRVRVLFQSAEEVERVGANQEWLSDVPGVRLIVEKGYPVKVDGVNKLALFETPESIKLREDVAKMVGKEMERRLFELAG